MIDLGSISLESSTIGIQLLFLSIPLFIMISVVYFVVRLANRTSQSRTQQLEKEVHELQQRIQAMEKEKQK
ncbi:hypothetical protein [Brevibacillus migulae]|uniref:hypothetical protein n=1 Tax=Brevibacillus migulae TaxID=1644114 RepID=UPI00106E8A2C|nr:hypothetical protein [Brevibacillus migulae]